MDDDMASELQKVIST